MVELHGKDSKIGLPTLWAIGVGSVLGGDFFGWQYIIYGGLPSGLVAIAFSAMFYWLYAGAITELAARYKTTGGAFDFVHIVLGIKVAAIMAILGFFKLVFANAALSLAISSYLVQAGLPSHLQFISWFITYGIFTLLDCIGIRESATGQIIATILCILILLFYSFSTVTIFSFSNAFSNGIIVDDILGFFKGLPFALQLFDGFEELPLIMIYAENSHKNVVAVADAGLLPSILKYRHPTHGAPIPASIFSSTFGIFLCVSFSYYFKDGAPFTLVTAALIPAILGYGIHLNSTDIKRLGNDPGELRNEGEYLYKSNDNNNSYIEKFMDDENTNTSSINIYNTLNTTVVTDMSDETDTTDVTDNSHLQQFSNSYNHYHCDNGVSTPLLSREGTIKTAT
eukprot:gene8020-16436_t